MNNIDSTNNSVPKSEPSPSDPIDYRIEKDSMGELKVPTSALYGAQTQRALDNFHISGIRFPAAFITALAQVKKAAALANHDLALLDPTKANAIVSASEEIIAGLHAEQFPLDIFQTGSGTSTNMNMNEVIAHIARAKNGEIHPNDDVNMSQSSNDVIPTSIHVSAALELRSALFPALENLQATLLAKAKELDKIVKTGRTHLMDAMPLTFGQELRGWADQIANNHIRLLQMMPQLLSLAQGGTAVGTGINAHPEFPQRFAQKLAENTGLDFTPARDFFSAISSQDTAVALSGQLKTLAVSLMKIANDLRWMNSGPLSGLGEIRLQPLQPGSSIMPGKVNPVIPEALAMACAQVIGNDQTITLAGQSGNFQLNVMLPVIAYNLLQSIQILSNAMQALAEKAIRDFTVNSDNIIKALAKNPILITALNAEIGYEKAAAIAKKAYAEARDIIDVAEQETKLSRADLLRLLDPEKLTRGGI